MTRPITNPIYAATLQRPVCWTRRPDDYPDRFTATVETSSALNNMYQKICRFCADRFLELRIVFRSICTIASSTSDEMQTQIGEIENFQKTINECENTREQKAGLRGAYLHMSEKLREKFVGFAGVELELYFMETDPEKAQEMKERFLKECSLLMTMQKLLIPIRNIFSRSHEDDPVTPPPSPRLLTPPVLPRPPVEPVIVEEEEVQPEPAPIEEPHFMDDPEELEEPNSPMQQIYCSDDEEEEVEQPDIAVKPSPVKELKPTERTSVSKTEEPNTAEKSDSLMAFPPAISSLDQFKIHGVGAAADSIRKLGRNIAAMGKFVPEDCYDYFDDADTRAIKAADYPPAAKALREKYQCASKQDGIPMTIPTFHDEALQEDRQDIDIMEAQLNKDENLTHPQYHGRKCALCNTNLNNTNVKIDVKLQKEIAQQLAVFISKMEAEQIIKRFQKLAIELGVEKGTTAPYFAWEEPHTFIRKLSKSEIKGKIADIIKDLPDSSVNEINIHDKIRGCYERNINQILK